MPNEPSRTAELATAQRQSGGVISGKYRLEREIGAGAMGSVWLATHLTLGQRVAIKLISKEHAHSREARARFDTEAKAAAKLRSRFVVQVYDNGETEDGTPYIVMEYLEGESLEERLQRAGPMALEETVRVISQVGRALERAHKLNIVHRDLKPANIFLSRSLDDDEIVAKVLDFGVAKVTDEATSTTRTGSVIGTPQFMSPEQVRGLKTVDHRTDLYALGMIGYSMLTGRVAFASEAFGDLLLAICTLPLPSIHQENPSLPPSLDGWFQRACARDADTRFQTATDLIDMLVVAAGLGRGSADVPELVPGPLTFARDGSSTGASHPVVPGPTTTPDPPPRAGAPGLETVGSATVPAGVPRPASVGKIVAVVAALLVLVGLGLGSAMFVWLRSSGEHAGLAATGPTAPSAAASGDETADETGADAGAENAPSSGATASSAPVASSPSVASARRPVEKAAGRLKAAAKKVRRAARKAAAPRPRPRKARRPREPDVGF